MPLHAASLPAKPHEPVAKGSKLRLPRAESNVSRNSTVAGALPEFSVRGIPAGISAVLMNFSDGLPVDPPQMSRMVGKFRAIDC